MKRLILLLILILASSHSVEAQGVIKRKKASRPKVSHLVQSSPSRPAPPASFGDGMLRVGDVSYKMVLVVVDSFDSFVVDAPPEQRTLLDWERSRHSVTLSADYYLGETEVTQALWQEVMGVNPSYFVGDDLPVENVSLYDCMEFVRHLNELTGLHFRLPTEVEWVYAARGGNRSRYYQYAGSNSIDEVAWYRDNSGAMTHPVKGKQPNELGFYDMSGNVHEWCLDSRARNSNVSRPNPNGSASGLATVFCGGNWFSDSSRCRIIYPDYFSSDHNLSFHGLRLALSE